VDARRVSTGVVGECRVSSPPPPPPLGLMLVDLRWLDRRPLSTENPNHGPPTTAGHRTPARRPRPPTRWSRRSPVAGPVAENQTCCGRRSPKTQCGAPVAGRVGRRRRCVGRRSPVAGLRQKLRQKERERRPTQVYTVFFKYNIITSTKSTCVTDLKLTSRRVHVGVRGADRSNPQSIHGADRSNPQSIRATDRSNPESVRGADRPNPKSVRGADRSNPKSIHGTETTQPPIHPGH
jgi:hypothetical protein